MIPPTDTRSYACASCGRVLLKRDNYKGNVFQEMVFEHGVEVPGVHCENLVAVPAEELGRPVVAVCDFCSNPGVAWTYPAEDFDQLTMMDSEKPGTTTYGSMGYWAACEQCHDAIEKSDWEAVLDNALPIQEATPQERPILSQLLLSLWRTFDKKRIGPAYRET